MSIPVFVAAHLHCGWRIPSATSLQSIGRFNRVQLAVFYHAALHYSMVERCGGSMTKLLRKDGDSALLGLAVLFHRDDDISLFVSLIDIPVSLDYVFQRIAPVYN